MIETKGIGGERMLLIEHYGEFRDVLQREGNNVSYAGVETREWITYFYVVLKK